MPLCGLYDDIPSPQVDVCVRTKSVLANPLLQDFTTCHVGSIMAAVEEVCFGLANKTVIAISRG